ncbi:MAG: GIY-YIG nuclease family protein [candidate division Zixibacteria bacterium]|nr:GIY-YIG nuclease family protein [candidate division Zixibacteria bacterium]
MKSLFVYIVECADGLYYTGTTNNVEVRVAKHNSGYYGGFTSGRRPVKLVFSQEFKSPFEAVTAERRIKGWSHAKKKALIDGDYDLLVRLSKSKKS